MRLELEVEPENVTEVLQSLDKIWMNKIFSAWKGFIEIEFVLGEDSMKIIKKKTKNSLDCYINWIDKKGQVW